MTEINEKRCGFSFMDILKMRLVYIGLLIAYPFMAVYQKYKNYRRDKFVEQSKEKDEQTIKELREELYMK